MSRRTSSTLDEGTLIEPPIEPELPIIDAHHHLLLLSEATLVAMEAQDSLLTRALAPNYRRHARYLFDEFVTDLGSGHNIDATVYVEAHTMYRARGPESMKSLGEIEFANGVAAMAASESFGRTKACSALVGAVDLTSAEEAEDVLRSHMEASRRYRGVRSTTVVAYDDDFRILGRGVGVPHLLLEGKFRAGFKLLQRMELSFDVWLLEPQLPDLIDLARAFPDTQIVLEHLGGPIGIGRYAGRRQERFPIWRNNMRVLSSCSNVVVKLGGLGISLGGFISFDSNPPATSLQLAEEWKPYIETCIETFGVNRCMFESNFPVESVTCSYRVLWNTFKRLTAAASRDEKLALFSGTAARIYRLSR